MSADQAHGVGVGAIVEWLRFPSSGSWYNARVVDYDKRKGYHVQVPGLDSLSEWVHSSRLRARQRPKGTSSRVGAAVRGLREKGGAAGEEASAPTARPSPRPRPMGHGSRDGGGDGATAAGSALALHTLQELQLDHRE